MCGIFCSLSSTHNLLPNDEIRRRLVNRGPDSTNTVETRYPRTPAENRDTATRNVHVTLCSTVLGLRGSKVVIQPYQSPDGKFTLCWNGEAWSIGGNPTAGNDTQAIHRLLTDALKPSSYFHEAPMDPLTSATIVSEALSTVAGPYAFVFFDHARGRLFFGRDFLGRRSLLKKTTADGDVILSSVSDGNAEDGWTEIEAVGVYCVDLHVMDAFSVLPGISVTSIISSDSYIRRFGRFIAAVDSYHYVENPRFEKATATATVKSVIHCLSLNKDISSYSSPLNEHAEAVVAFENVLRQSLLLRVSNIPERRDSSASQTYFGRSKLAILFSGGLDCTVLARMSHDLLPSDEPIDLLNVAFENPRIHKDINAKADGNAYELCPDRITGRASFEELRKTCPGRSWRFVAIDVPYSETLEHREKVISLMYPHNTEMDLSISLALYFAARGTGKVQNADGPALPYTTAARVLLSGLGADELFGGYTRHSNAFRRGGLDGLLQELELDVSRLGQRNLGRDDRIMARWSKEVRFPYLDEHLLHWALNAPVFDKCGFGEPDIDSSTGPGSGVALEPEKKVLRCLAWKLGMEGVAKEKKRAIQFGARTAKMETRKTKGTQLLSQ